MFGEALFILSFKMFETVPVSLSHKWCIVRGTLQIFLELPKSSWMAFISYFVFSFRESISLHPVGAGILQYIFFIL